MTRLKYGNTNTYFVRGTSGGLWIDTDGIIVVEGDSNNCILRR